MVRGFALRSLCSLKLESILEYVAQPLQKSLSDISAYVRKTGVMGVLKVDCYCYWHITTEHLYSIHPPQLYKLSPAFVIQSDYLSTVWRMLQDIDTNVICNAIVVLTEIAQLYPTSESSLSPPTRASSPHSPRRLPTDKEHIFYFLTRIHDFSEWGLHLVLQLIKRYSPETEDEVFNIMTILDPLLRTSNSGTVVAILSCFLTLTQSMPDIHPQLFLRVKAPLLTLLTSNQPEVQFTLLKLLEVLLQQPAAKGAFDDEYRHFFIRYNEPLHIKHAKLNLLPLVANHPNVADILSEMTEYASDVDATVACLAVRAMGDVAVHVPNTSQLVMDRLVALLTLDISHLRLDTLQTSARLLTRQPSLHVFLSPHVRTNLSSAEGEERDVWVWFLGAFGEHIVEAPYLLEPLIDSYTEEPSVSLKLALLHATTRLFFKRPPEMAAMIGRLLSSALSEGKDLDVQDRALFLFRLLRRDPSLVLPEQLYAALEDPSSFTSQEDRDGAPYLCSLPNTISQQVRSPAYLHSFTRWCHLTNRDRHIRNLLLTS